MAQDSLQPVLHQLRDRSPGERRAPRESAGRPFEPEITGFNKATRIPYYALAYVETGRAKGKVVITVAG